MIAEPDHEVVESIGQMHMKVHRSSGARGHVAIPYKSIEGTAKAGRDFIPVHGEIVFSNDEHEYVNMGSSYLYWIFKCSKYIIIIVLWIYKFMTVGLRTPCFLSRRISLF